MELKAFSGNMGQVPTICRIKAGHCNHDNHRSITPGRGVMATVIIFINLYSALQGYLTGMGN